MVKVLYSSQTNVDTSNNCRKMRKERKRNKLNFVNKKRMDFEPMEGWINALNHALFQMEGLMLSRSKAKDIDGKRTC